MRIRKVTIDHFRCFEHLELDFSNPEPDEYDFHKGWTTVLVAANGEGKTAVLEAVRYLLSAFIGRFPNHSAMRLKDSDYREVWQKEVNLLGESFKKLPRAPFMRLIGKADFPAPDLNSEKPLRYLNDYIDRAEWELFQKRDQTSFTKKELPDKIGLSELYSKADEIISHDNFEEYRPLPIIVYFNTERAVIRNKPEHRRGFQKSFNRYDAYTGALDSGLDYKKMIEWFCFLEDQQRREKEQLRDWDYQSLEMKTVQLALERMLPGFRNLRTILKPLDLVVEVRQGDTFKTCRIDSQLSDGYKIVLVLVLDIVSRILEANAHIDGMTSELLLEASGIILIDEVDLHLHPSWQQRIMGDLRRTFPCLQFIVTTHSPQVVSSVPKEWVKIIDQGQVIPFDIQTQGVESQDILANIFGTDSAPRQDEYVQKLAKYAEMEARGDAATEEGISLYRELAEHFGEKYAPLQRIEIHRRFMERRKEMNHA